MADPFEKELETLVARYARDLTREITSIILRRLGVSSAGASASSHGRAPRRAKAEAKPARTQKPTEAPRRRGRPSAEDKTAAEEKVARVLGAGKGVSVGELEKALGLSRGAVAGAIKTLKQEGRAFMGGNRRFARYAATQAAADQASKAARGV